MSTSHPAAVLFDLDGTLVDTEPLYYEATRRILAHNGVPGYTEEQHARFIGIGTLESLETLAAEGGLAPSPADLLAGLNAVYLELLHASTEVFPQMRKFVELLHADGVPLAVASGSSREAITAALENGGIARAFPVVVSAEEVAAGKPEPDVFLEAARRLGVAPERCVVVEDSAPGVAAARAAGMRCVAVPSVSAGSQPDPVFGSADVLFPGGQAGFTAEVAYARLFGGAAH